MIFAPKLNNTQFRGENKGRISMSLLYDKSDTRFSDDDLQEINQWAKSHADTCPMMNTVIQGHGVMHYGIEYWADFGEIEKVGYCPCGCRYYVGGGEELPVGMNKENK